MSGPFLVYSNNPDEINRVLKNIQDTHTKTLSATTQQVQQISSSFAGLSSASPSGSGVPTSRRINTGIGLIGGGSLASDLTLLIDPVWPGSTSITTLGTVTTGIWNSTKIGLAYGGTNADLSSTGGTSQVLKQLSPGAPITVGALTASDVGAVPLTRSLTFNGLAQDLSSDRIWNINGNGTALKTGGVVTQASGTTIDISAGTGIIYDSSTQTNTNVSWSAISGYSLAANIAAGKDASYIFIDSTGSVVTQTVDPTGQNIRNLIYISKVAHRSGSSITNVRDLRLYGEEPLINLNELTLAVGSINLSGNVISNYGATLQVQKSAGTAYRFFYNADADRKNPSYISDVALTPITFVYCQQKTGGDVLFTPSQTVINPSQYDVGDSTLAAVANNRYTIQRIYYFPRTNSIYVFYGRVIYTSMAAALAAITTEQFDTGTDFFDGAILRCYLTVRGSATDLSVSTDAVFTATGKFSGAGAGSIGGLINMQGVYNASAQPQIVTSTAAGAIQFKRGTAADTDDVFEILNGVGSITSYIKGNGDLFAGSLSLTTALADAYISSASTWNAKQNAYTNLTSIGSLANAAGVLSNDGSGTFSYVSAGTVTSVSAITLGTTGTDLSSTVANSTTTPVITLQVPTASATNRGALSSTDWSTFNGKQAAYTNLTSIGSLANAAGVLSNNGSGTFSYVSVITNPMTTLGDTLYGAASGVVTRLAGPTANGTYVKAEVVTGAASVAPSWLNLDLYLKSPPAIGITTPGSGYFTNGSHTGPVTFSGNNITSTPGSIRRLNASGLVIQATTGASRDFGLIDAAGTNVYFSLPVGSHVPDFAFGFNSFVPNGTAPFSVTSTTVVPNLNVSQLLGNTWAVPGTIGSTTPNTGAFTTLSANSGQFGTGSRSFPLEVFATGTNAIIGLHKTDTSTADWYIHAGRHGTGEFSIGDASVYLFWMQQTTGNATFAGTLSSSSLTASTVKATSAAGYISSDGSTGVTTTITTASLVGKTITVKDGIITGFA